MLEVVKSAALAGLEAFEVQIEVDVARGLPAFSIVGLPDTAVQESRERVKSAIKNSEFELGPRRVVVNLAPADIKKEGPSFDLPIAIGTLLAHGTFVQKPETKEYWLVGELSLTGEVKPVKGILSIAIGAAKRGVKRLLVALENASEAAAIKDIEIIPVGCLYEAVQFLSGQIDIQPQDSNQQKPKRIEGGPDFSEVKGQYQARRGLEIAAAGGHNMLMIGPPGSGKTMLAARLPTIMPELTIEEAIDVTKIYSVTGDKSQKEGLIWQRPFRAPHHTISFAGLVGGGQKLRPGEVTLSHNGVLFLDELPQFGPGILQALRQPLEARIITITRATGSQTYPASFMFIGAMNPCPCGYLGDEKRECGCPSGKIRTYRGRISGPLLDRIDMHVEVARLSKSDLVQTRSGETSEAIGVRVVKARDRQHSRFNNEPVLNSRLSPKQVKDHCRVTKEARDWLDTALDKILPTARGYDRLLKVARTIADLCGNVKIELADVAEAAQYRSFDRDVFY